MSYYSTMNETVTTRLRPVAAELAAAYQSDGTVDPAVAQPFGVESVVVH